MKITDRTLDIIFNTIMISCVIAFIATAIILHKKDNCRKNCYRQLEKQKLELEIKILERDLNN